MGLLLEMPERGIATQVFEPEEVDASAPERSGRLGGVTLGFPLWRARWELSRNLTREASDEWRAFFARLRRSQRPFVAHDRDRLYPRAYPGGFARMTTPAGAPFTGAATSWSQAVDGDGDARITLGGLPSGLLLGTGDYVGFRWDAAGSPAGSNDRRTLVRLVEPATADSAGAAAVLVEPVLPTLVVPAGAVAHLDRPGCIMRLAPGESGPAPLDRRQKIAGGTILALQDLRP